MAAGATHVLQFGKTGSGCIIANPMDRRLLEENPGGVSLTWSGGCDDGRASGTGVAEGRLNNQVIWRYEGQMDRGLLNGPGTFHGPNGLTVAGTFRDSRVEGRITLDIAGKYHYEGGWALGKREGIGSYVGADGIRYEGGWHDGLRQGNGTVTAKDGSRYEGEWDHDMPSGYGVLTRPDSTVYKGNFRQGRPDGRGVEIMNNGTRIDGEWQHGAPAGQASVELPGKGRYEGELRGWKFDGTGTFTASDGSRFEGHWQDGKPEGEGTLTRSGEPPFSGAWHQGCFHQDDRRAAFAVAASACR